MLIDAPTLGCADADSDAGADADPDFGLGRVLRSRNASITDKCEAGLFLKDMDVDRKPRFLLSPS